MQKRIKHVQTFQKNCKTGQDFKARHCGLYPDTGAVIAKETRHIIGGEAFAD